jgi:ion channel POLLUX/CASTOR
VPPPAVAKHAAPKVSFRQRLRYRFDTSLARGPLVLIGWLGMVVLVIVVVAAVVGRFLLGGAAHGGFLESFWGSLLRVLDPAAFESETAWPSRLVWLVVALLGILIGGSLIGLIAAGIDRRVDDLRKGRSPVLETDHTLILGWSARLPVIVKELALANESRTRPAVVILAPRDVTDMTSELRDRVGDTKNTRVVCRTGNPWQPAHLQVANIASARSVIVLAGEHGDAAVVKTLLAVKTLDPDFSRANVVAEFDHPEHALTVRSITGGAVGTVNSDDVIAQVTAQACHQAGLSVVFRELLDFEGHECYFAEVPELAGHTYAEALLAFDHCSVIGRLGADGLLQLNPAATSVFQPGDQVIAVAEDDETLRFTGFRDVPIAEPASPGHQADEPLRVLIVGWSGFGPTVVKELDEFLAPGSLIEVSVDPSLADPHELDQTVLANATLRVSFLEGGPEELDHLRGRRPFDQVIVLGYRDKLTVDDADSRTLLTLLTLRDIWSAHAVPRVRIIGQLLDQANAELAGTTGVDDFIVSDALASLMLAQLSERAELQAVFDDLFDPKGAVVVLRPAHGFVPDAPVRYEQIVAAGAALGVSVLGWRVDATGEVVVNPPKAATVHLAVEDQVLVIGLRAPEQD